MWRCSKCGEKHADHFSACWKCAGMEAPLRSVAVATAPAPLACLRCNSNLEFAGTQALRDEVSGEILGGLGGLSPDHEQLKVYVCARCGRLELFVDGFGNETGAASSEAGGTEMRARNNVERLIRDGNALEYREQWDGAIAVYEEVRVKYPGTNYAREAEEHLNTIRTKLGI